VFTTKKRIAYYFVIALACISFAIILLNIPFYFDKQRDGLAKEIDRTTFTSMRLDRLIHGEWDLACTIGEYDSPEDVTRIAGFAGLRFVDTGWANRRVLLEGESGVLLIRKSKKEFSLALFYGRDRIKVILDSSKRELSPCFIFHKTRLVKFTPKIAVGDWIYLRLEDVSQ